MLKAIGYWTDTKSDEMKLVDPQLLEDDEMKLIDPKLLVDASWEVARRSKIVTYLQSGAFLSAELGYSYCRFENGPPDAVMGDSDFTDGIWAWPEGLAIYVERYHVRLPDEFISHMAKNDFTVPKNINARAINTDEGYDFDFWMAWCKHQESKSAAHSAPTAEPKSMANARSQDSAR